jgi:hypothetical protein
MAATTTEKPELGTATNILFDGWAAAQLVAPDLFLMKACSVGIGMRRLKLPCPFVPRLSSMPRHVHAGDVCLENEDGCGPLPRADAGVHGSLRHSIQNHGRVDGAHHGCARVRAPLAHAGDRAHGFRSNVTRLQGPLGWPPPRTSVQGILQIPAVQGRHRGTVLSKNTLQCVPFPIHAMPEQTSPG